MASNKSEQNQLLFTIAAPKLGQIFIEAAQGVKPQTPKDAQLRTSLNNLGRAWFSLSENLAKGGLNKQLHVSNAMADIMTIGQRLAQEGAPAFIKASEKADAVMEEARTTLKMPSAQV